MVLNRISRAVADLVVDPNAPAGASGKVRLVPNLRLRPARHPQPVSRVRNNPTEKGNNLNLNHYQIFWSSWAIFNAKAEAGWELSLALFAGFIPLDANWRDMLGMAD